jgi:SAM-dependent methyltransferase
MADNSCPLCLGNRVRFACPAVLCLDCVRNISECPDCGAAFYHPAPSADEIARCYPPAYFGTFFKQYWRDYYKGRAIAARLSPWRASGDFLDTGCALGTMLAGLRDHSDWRVRGLEFSAPAAELGRRLNSVEIASCPLSEAPYPPQSFDYILLNNVLEHEPAPRAAMASVARMLRPGGRLELIVPNGPVDLLPNRTLSRKWGCAVHTRHGGHLFFFSRRSLQGLLESCGLRVISLRCFHLKLGIKARGWLPRSYRNFKKDTWAEAAAAKVEELSLEQGRAMIPPRPSWPRYLWGDRMKRFWRFSGSEFGYDFEVMAEKI